MAKKERNVQNQEFIYQAELKNLESNSKFDACIVGNGLSAF